MFLSAFPFEDITAAVPLPNKIMCSHSAQKLSLLAHDQGGVRRAHIFVYHRTHLQTVHSKTETINELKTELIRESQTEIKHEL